MTKDCTAEVLLKQHEELVNIYMHQNRIEWILISVYVALNVGLASAVATLFAKPRMGAIASLSLFALLYSFGGCKLFKKYHE